jgi:RyR domain/ATPase family associated with various cellular activities (AAA)
MHMSLPNKPMSILVTGDPICDCHFYSGERATADSPKARGFRISRINRGGALLLNDLIREVLDGHVQFTIEFGLDIDLEQLPSHYQGYCLWEPQIANPQEKDLSKQDHIWRASEPLLGYGHPENDGNSKGSLGLRRNDLEIPDILVIDDAGLDFRKESSRSRWPIMPEGGDKCPRWVVLKLSGSVGEGGLWSSIVANCPDNLIVVVSGDQIRRTNIRLSRGFSWEATVEDLQAELFNNPVLKPLLKARHVIVTFRSDGAFWLNNTLVTGSETPIEEMLVFDGTRAEGDWAAAQGKGAVFGYLSCFTAAIVWELCRGKESTKPDICSALTAGLSASRELRRLGHGLVTIQRPGLEGKQEPNPTPRFPLTEVARCVREPKDRFVSTLLPPDPSASRRGKWMMLDEWQVKARDGKRSRPYHRAAYAAAILGPEALERFPVARFGDLLTVDRQEIENLRILQGVIRDYERSAGRDARPLNLGVFGPPGAGKSFGVKEIAKAVLGEKVPFLTFNLSQFSNPDHLNGALHQVRDKVLAGTTPVVFWDEFDSESYRWLQYLLAPMNDGVFLEGQITHPVGKCIFIFAGATSYSFETFGPINPDEQHQPEEGSYGELAKLPTDVQRRVNEQWADFVRKKGPDFKSRLVSYLNVLGPNRRLYSTHLGPDGQRHAEEDPEDLCWPIRRAFFIRQRFKLKDGQRLEIDSGVLHALLEISVFKSGSRSLEFLCNHIRDRAAEAIPRRSHLPGQHLLDMHVDATEFWRICERDLEFLPFAPILAPALHEAYRLRIKGRETKKHLDVPFNELPEDMQAANMGQALRIPEILRIAQMKLIQGTPIALEKLVRARIAEEETARKCLAEPPTLELLAEAEHNGWMVERMLRGWRYASQRDDTKLLHDNLIPYNQLPDATKEYDRQTIIGVAPSHGRPELEQFGYIDLVKTAGLRVVAMDPVARKG